MSVVSKNPFDLLGDDGEPSPSPASTKAAQPAAAKKPAASTAPRTVPGAATGGQQRGGGARGGRYPSRGGPRNVYREDNGPRNTGPDPASGTTEGLEGPGGFEGERVAPPKKSHHGPDKHTRASKERGAYTSGGHRSRGAGNVRGAKTPAGGAERRQFERRSGGLPDSQKKVDQGWGSNDGPRELDAEELGEGDAQAEENAPQTPAAEDGGWGAAEGDAPAEADATPAEPEEVQKSYDQFLAERAEAALSSGLGKKEVRTVTSETLEGQAFRREGMDEFFSGKEKSAARSKGPKKEKVFIEFEGQFAPPSRGGRDGERGGRGGRGGRGFSGGRGGERGGRGRGGRGRGGFGGQRGGAGSQGLDGSDDKAFPALGA